MSDKYGSGQDPYIYPERNGTNMAQIKNVIYMNAR